VPITAQDLVLWSFLYLSSKVSTTLHMHHLFICWSLWLIAT